MSVVGHSYGGMLAVRSAPGGGYQAAVNVDGIGFRVPGSPMEDLAQDDESTRRLRRRAATQSGDADVDGAELAARRPRQPGWVCSWHLTRSCSGGGSSSGRTGRGTGRRPWTASASCTGRSARELLPTYAATRCRTVTVLADRRDGPSPERVAASERHAELVREALTRLPPTSPARHLATVATGHYPQFEAPSRARHGADHGAPGLTA